MIFPLSSTERGDFLPLLDLGRSCCFIERGGKKANPRVVGACRGASQIHPLWMERDVLQWLFWAARFLKPGLLTTWQAEGPHKDPGWTTPRPEGECHSPDPRVGIQQCWRDVRTTRDVGSLRLFLGKENQQRSQLKSCHPIWQRLCRTIHDISEYADWKDTAPHGCEKGWPHPYIRCRTVTLAQSCCSRLDFQLPASSGCIPSAASGVKECMFHMTFLRLSLSLCHL